MTLIGIQGSTLRSADTSSLVDEGDRPAAAGTPSRIERHRWQRWWSLGIMLLGTVVMTLPMIWGGVRLGQDTATQFYPWYANLGERLRAGGVPEWNPTQFGGTPLAADPQSGWMYLPAMLAFTILPFTVAVIVQIFGHLLLVNLGTWLLARRIGLGQVGALVAGFSLAGSGVLYGRIPSGPASYQVVTWLPWVLLGAEIAIRSRTWPVRIAGWGLTGFAITQALAAWVGQVSYYTLLLLAAWLVFRVLWGGVERSAPGGGRWSRLLVPVGSLGRGASPLPPVARFAWLDVLTPGSARRSSPSARVAPAMSGLPQRPTSSGDSTSPACTIDGEQQRGSGTPGPLRGPDGASPTPTGAPGAGAFPILRHLPPHILPSLGWPTLTRLVIHGATMLVIGLGLSAAGLLPRLEFNGVSNAAGGEYATTIGGVIGGSTSESVIGRLFQPSLYYPGAAVLALAVVGLLLGRGRFGTPFWVLTALGAIVLTAPAVTPLHWLLYLLPHFRSLHEHWPERVILIAFPGLALLAGAGAQSLVDAVCAPANAVLRGTAVLLPGLILAGFGLLGGGVSGTPIVAVILVALVTAALLFRGRLPGASSASASRKRSRSRLAHWLPATLVVIVVADLMLMTQALAGQAPFGGFHRRDLDAYYAPSGAAAFLQEQQDLDGPFRFAGYDPAIGVVENGQRVLYRYQFSDPITQELVVNNRATILGLEDIQGYNPIQIQGYVDLVTAMNGEPQEYHGSNLYPDGLDSPLLGLLNVRYLIVPTVANDGRAAMPALETWPTVFDDGTVRVVENPSVMPRLWAVSETRMVSEGDALPLLASGGVDPLVTALFESGVGPDAPSPSPPEPDALPPTLTLRPSADPDTFRFDATVATDTVVVLSEIAYPGWVAEIDGVSTDVLTADHTLRAVIVPAGQHLVTLRYDSPATRYGLVITITTLLIVVVAWLVSVWRTQASSRASPSPSGGALWAWEGLGRGLKRRLANSAENA